MRLRAAGVRLGDRKPENLYLTTRVGGAGFVKVLDFGVSKTVAMAGALTTTSAVVGSPMYMAPEQMRSARVADPRSDVWALGIVLYELLTERCPFEAESLPELCLKITRDPHRPVAEMRFGLRPELAAVVERCLQKDPARRYANAAELGAALEPFVPAYTSADASSARRVMRSLGETMAEQVAVAEPAPADTRRARRPLSLGALALCAAVAAGVWVATRPASGPPRFAFAAVDAVRSASSLAQDANPSPETLAPLPAPTAASAASERARASAPQPRPMMMRAPRSPSSPRPHGDDDIPAYR